MIGLVIFLISETAVAYAINKGTSSGLVLDLAITDSRLTTNYSILIGIFVWTT